MAPFEHSMDASSRPDRWNQLKEAMKKPYPNDLGKTENAEARESIEAKPELTYCVESTG